jgi:hypothetical protein
MERGRLVLDKQACINRDYRRCLHMERQQPVLLDCIDAMHRDQRFKRPARAERSLEAIA